MVVREVVIDQLVDLLGGLAIGLVVHAQTPLLFDGLPLVFEILLGDGQRVHAVGFQEERQVELVLGHDFEVHRAVGVGGAVHAAALGKDEVEMLAGIDEEGLTDQELEAEMRSIEGALRGLPEGSCLYQYTRVMSGFDLPRKEHYANSVTQVFVDDRLAFLEKTAGFRRIDLYWCLTLEPPKAAAFARKPKEH